MKKLFVIPSLCALLLTTGFTEQTVFAAETMPTQQSEKVLPPAGAPFPPQLKDGKRLPLPPSFRRPQLSKTEAAGKLQAAYGYRYSELLLLLEAGHPYEELNQACLYTYLADAPIEKVLQLRQTATWGRVKAQLGLTPKIYADKYM